MNQQPTESLRGQFEKETGEKALYRMNSSDYHTLKYVTWLESRLYRKTDWEKVAKEINMRIGREAVKYGYAIQLTEDGIKEIIERNTK